MDVFSRTFLPVAVTWAGGAIPAGGRQLPVLRRCIEANDAPVLLTRCTAPQGAVRGGYLLLLTHRRLVVTRQTGLLCRVRLHLNAELRHLGDVFWHADDRRCVVELAATAMDGVRERFLIRTSGPEPVWRIDALLQRVFRPTAPVPAGPMVAIPPPPGPAPAAIRTSRPVRRAAVATG